MSSVEAPTTSVAVVSKDVCLLCDKPFCGKQKCIRCCVCELRFHWNCLKSNISECNGDAATGKLSFTCDSCVIANNRALIQIRHYPLDGDSDSLSEQLKAVRLNGVCTMEMLKSPS